MFPMSRLLRRVTGRLSHLSGRVALCSRRTLCRHPCICRGVMALVVQHMGSRQGNATPRSFSGRQARAGGASVFHDITGGQQQRAGTTRLQRHGGIRSGNRPRYHRCFCPGQSLERRNSYFDSRLSRGHSREFYFCGHWIEQKYYGECHCQRRLQRKCLILGDGVASGVSASLSFRSRCLLHGPDAQRAQDRSDQQSQAGHCYSVTVCRLQVAAPQSEDAISVTMCAPDVHLL